MAKKKDEPVKGLGKPKNMKEADLLERRLVKKYPQMYEPGWGKTPEGKSFIARQGARLKKVFGAGSKGKKETAASLLTNYAKRTGQPKTKGEK